MVSNFRLRRGSESKSGRPVMTLVDSDSFYVSGYFEETKLGHIHEGQHATIRLMGQDRVLEGHVVGVSAAISDSERTTATGTLLADVRSEERRVGKGVGSTGRSRWSPFH